ncbi:MAG: (deoxy)nucleoside triphosphate pyrophosphohydrolase [Bacillota bacterium]
MIDVSAAILIKDNLILIAKRDDEDFLANLWEFPGGKVEEGETPQQCLVREMKEEFNVEVSVGNFFAESIYHYSHASVRLLAYWTVLEGGQLTPHVHKEIKFIPVQDLNKYSFAPADIPLVEKLKKYFRLV